MFMSNSNTTTLLEEMKKDALAIENASSLKEKNQLKKDYRAKYGQDYIDVKKANKMIKKSHKNLRKIAQSDKNKPINKKNLRKVQASTFQVKAQYEDIINQIYEHMSKIMVKNVQNNYNKGRFEGYLNDFMEKLAERCNANLLTVEQVKDLLNNENYGIKATTDLLAPTCRYCTLNNICLACDRDDIYHGKHSCHNNSEIVNYIPKEDLSVLYSDDLVLYYINALTDKINSTNLTNDLNETRNTIEQVAEKCGIYVKTPANSTTQNTTQNTTESSPKGLSGAAIGGIASGSVATIALGLGIFYKIYKYCKQQKKRGDIFEKKCKDNILNEKGDKSDRQLKKVDDEEIQTNSKNKNSNIKNHDIKNTKNKKEDKKEDKKDEKKQEKDKSHLKRINSAPVILRTMSGRRYKKIQHKYKKQQPNKNGLIIATKMNKKQGAMPAKINNNLPKSLVITSKTGKNLNNC